MSLVRKIVGTGILSAIVIALTFFSNYISFGPVSITLALIPIVIGAVIYGPITGLFLGLVNGAIVLLAPSTGIFISHNLGITIVLCLTKTGVAGLIAGLLPLLMKKHEKVAVITSSILVPIINTGIFILFCLGFFMDIFPEPTPSYLIMSVIGINFIIEFAVNAILSPTIYYIVNIVKERIFAKGNKNGL